jgi:hypothetical protein
MLWTELDLETCILSSFEWMDDLEG